MPKRKTKEDFIKSAIRVHGEKYDYSKVEYINNKTKVCIICPEHGEFWMRPDCHTVNKQGCPKCGYSNLGASKRTGLEKFIEQAQEIHGIKYDYSKVEYVTTETKVCIICPEHGEFWQTPHNHIGAKQGCPSCYGNRRKTNEEFVKDVKAIHGDKYDYSKSQYINARTKLCVICPEHGEFWIKPNDILNGHGCPKCYHSLLEEEVRKILTVNNLHFVEQKTFEGLKSKNLLRFDFYLVDLNLLIECQGEQHYEYVRFSNKTTEDSFLETQMRDQMKKAYCVANDIPLLYYTHYKNITGDDVCKTEAMLLSKIWNSRK